MNPYISIISPVYKAELSVLPLVEQIKLNLLSITENFELILVEDGSPDGSWDKIVLCCLQDERVKGIKLSRNFGQHYAITAGMEASSGDKIILMDCDLQDDPKYIPELIKESEKGYDIVYTLKTARKHSFIKNIFAKFFFTVFNLLLDNKSNEADKNIGSYSLLSRKVVDAFVRVHDYHRHYLLILRWLGYSHSYLKIEHQKRPYGKSSYNFGKLVSHALNGITSQSNRLLYFSIAIGLVFFIASVLGIAVLISLYFIQGFKQGWASMIVLTLLSTGLIMLSLGITGIYIAKIFDQVKNRPLYLLDKKINFKN